MTLSIGKLAKLTEETVKTLRYWTDLGLLTSERGDNGYRYYQLGMSKRATFIRSAQALGFSLSQIGDILALGDEGIQPCDEVRQELAKHLLEVRQRIADLQKLEHDLALRLSWAEAHPEPDCKGELCVYLNANDEVIKRGKA